MRWRSAVPKHPTLPITRYWTPVADAMNSGDGYWVDDHEWYRKIVRPETKTLSELAELPCLLLVGEPAMGKSKAVEQEFARLKSSLPDGDSVSLIDLSIVSSDGGLNDEFERRDIRDWRAGNGILHLFVDSYDECLRRYSPLRKRLLARLDD